VSDPAAEFDGPWKEALDLYFRQFAELLFGHLIGDVDWEQPIEFLDKELQKIAPEAEAGRGSVDKLVRVWTRSGFPQNVLVHVEVQSQKDTDFAQRMYRYNHRLEDRYGQMPASFAVFADDDLWWRPEEYQAARWGCGVKFHFAVAKVMDYRGREAELEASPNPFAAFVLAQLKANETKDNPDGRLGWKLRVVKGLYDRGMSGPEIRKLFRLVAWVMALPAPQMATFRAELEAFEKERAMPVITPLERTWLEDGIARGRAEGRAEGMHAGIEAVLEIRFGAEGLALMPRIRQITDSSVLEQLLRASRTAPDLDALRNMLPPQA
jgi:hypothetical protein